MGSLKKLLWTVTDSDPCRSSFLSYNDVSCFGLFILVHIGMTTSVPQTLNNTTQWCLRNDVANDNSLKRFFNLCLKKKLEVLAINTAKSKADLLRSLVETECTLLIKKYWWLNSGSWFEFESKTIHVYHYTDHAQKQNSILLTWSFTTKKRPSSSSSLGTKILL